MNKVTKLNPSIDIIPLQGSSSDIRYKTMSNRRPGLNPGSIYGDSLILDRVQMYLYENEDKVYVDINKMSDTIQKKYREYRNKKRGPFREMVRKAYDAINESISTRPQWKEDEDEVELSDSQNDQDEVLRLYKRSLSRKNGNTSDKELIDISSDDDQRKLDVMPCKKDTDGSETNERSRKRSMYQSANSTEQPRDQTNFTPSEELNMPLLKIAGPELVAGVSGESEARIRELFDQALALSPCVLFLDEIDALAPHRATAQKEMERRIVSQLLACLDDLGKKENGNRVLVVGATNRPDALDPALRRAGRFDREVSLGIPDKKARQSILAVHTANVKLSADADLSRLASLTPGFVGADLVALIREASMAAINRMFMDMKEKIINEETANIENENNRISMDEEVTEIMAAEIKLTEEEQKSQESITEQERKEKINKVDSGLQHCEHKPSESEVIIEEDTTIIPTNSLEYNTPVMCEAEVKMCKTIPEKGLAAEIISKNGAVEIKKNAQLEQSQELNLLSWLHNEPLISSKHLETLFVEQRDFEAALCIVQPSAKREGFATVPDVTWDDIGSLQDIRHELQMSILAPVKQAEQCELLGLSTPSGLLLCGPPGCGKTLMAKAIANEAEINFISVKGPELLNMYVGESERAVRQCFMRARNSVPCVIFFDELDALCPKRSEGDNSSTSRVVNQMLTEMDGIEGRKGVFVMAASNRPDIIDPAVLRPGRLDKIVYVGLPTATDRTDILRALTKNGTKPKLAADVNLSEIANDKRCEGYTGADLAALMREAGIQALTELIANPSIVPEVRERHVNAAFNKVLPSVHEKDIKHYEKLKKLYTVTSNLLDIPLMEMPVHGLIDTIMEEMET
ncbi:nuclear valosin-containing protein-like isoform X2 [Belonocnema kinseyi]|uniref:nuclear valosin-containing protein-like isoform X2 n=1 Tax=Belonocnema kinseyi TaxID=2817044 RepID=UPI00143E030F|nr:nuclear valosin-containing protein-like isoform X2 [Belonocnema kinseyi]